MELRGRDARVVSPQAHIHLSATPVYQTGSKSEVIQLHKMEQMLALRAEFFFLPYLAVPPVQRFRHW